MKSKQKVDIASAILILLLGSFLLLCPLIGLKNINTLFIPTMVYLTIINLGKFLMTREYHDYEGILTAISSLLIGSLAFFIKVNERPIHLALLLFGWVILESFVKLKKADYYNDRKSKFWILEICFLIIFIVMGILTSINLFYTEETQILLMGYFFFTNGILEFIDPIIIYLTKERIKR